MSNTDTDKPSVDVTAVEHSQDADIQEQESIFKAFVVTVQHFFGGFHRLFQGVTDPRHPAYITYPLPALMATGVLMFLLRLGARRQVGNLLRGNGASDAKYQILFGVESCPHADTLKYLYARSDVADVQEVVTGMTETLIRRKVLYRHRLLDKYFLVVVDGTGMRSFSRRHCPYCMTRTYQGYTFYYHPVLEAKLVTSTGFVFSLMMELIENDAGNEVEKTNADQRA